MTTEPVVFTYIEADGSVGTIPFNRMRRLWVDRDGLGMAWVETGEHDAASAAIEIANLDDPEAVQAMECVMREMVADPRFAILENPQPEASRSCLRLEFRYPSPHAVYLAEAS